MQLKDINFPVYFIGYSEPMVVDNIHFFMYIEESDDSAPKCIYRIIDDKNRPEETFALRRLAMYREGVSLYKLNKAIFFISDLLKITKGMTWFIDTKGTVFSYKKTKRVPLVYKKIKKIYKIPTGGAVIELHDIVQRYKVLHMPILEQTWAGLLDMGNSYLLYGIYSSPGQKTYRMI